MIEKNRCKSQLARLQPDCGTIAHRSMDTLIRRVRRNNFAEADAGLQWKDLLRPAARTTLVLKLPT
jgi:hypothetical protein